MRMPVMFKCGLMHLAALQAKFCHRRRDAVTGPRLALAYFRFRFFAATVRQRTNCCEDFGKRPQEQRSQHLAAATRQGDGIAGFGARSAASGAELSELEAMVMCSAGVRF